MAERQLRLVVVEKCTIKTTLHLVPSQTTESVGNLRGVGHVLEYCRGTKITAVQ